MFQRFNVQIYSRSDGKKCLYSKYTAKLVDGRSEAELRDEIKNEITSSLNIKRAMRYRSGCSTARDNLDIRITKA